MGSFAATEVAEEARTRGFASLTLARFALSRSNQQLLLLGDSVNSGSCLLRCSFSRFHATTTPVVLPFGHVQSEDLPTWTHTPDRWPQWIADGHQQVLRRTGRPTTGGVRDGGDQPEQEIRLWRFQRIPSFSPCSRSLMASCSRRCLVSARLALAIQSTYCLR